MELISREMPSDYNLYDLSDLHIGTANSAISSIREVICEIASNKRNYVIIKGDLADCIVADDKRFAVTSLDGQRVQTPQDQTEFLISLLTPIRKRLLFLQLGNHEYKLINTFDIVRELCKALDVPWGGLIAKFTHLHNGKPKWKGLYCHGNGSIKSQAKDPIQALANQKALLKKKLQPLSSDVVYMSMGHCHRLILVEPTVEQSVHLIDDGERIKQTYRVATDQTQQYIDPEARWYAATGSFLRTMSEPGLGQLSYAEMAMYPPVEMGYVKQRIEGHRMVDAERVVV